MLSSFLLLFLFNQSANAEPTEYALLANKGTLYIKVYKDLEALGASLAHDHAIKAVGWSGKATWDAASPEACKLSVIVPVNNLQVDQPEMRATAGLEGEVSDSQRSEITKNMLAEGQLNSATHPTIEFKATGCTGTGEKITLKGNFTLRGVTKPISIPVTVSTEDGLRVKGNFPIKATDYGFEPYSAMFGQIRNSNKMQIYLDLRGQVL
jgi:polyisoprenoid-binding protein YceI